MDDAAVFIALIILVIILVAIVLPIVAIVISANTRRKLNQTISRLESSGAAPPSSTATVASVLQQLTLRVARLEAAISTQRTEPVISAEELPSPVSPTPAPPPPTAQAPPRPISEPPPRPIPPPPPIPTRPMDTERLESIIGRRWLGWAAVALILFATAFFLKYAFDNRWIGELGRVAIGVTAGIILTVLGYRYHKRKWRVFSQILTSGGVVVLYLSAYASFGYYHLATQKAAFAYIAILIAEAAALALLYDAPAIAVVALIGGFLSPVLLRSDRDQYRSLFGYIFALDLGTLALLRRWWGLSSLAFFGTQLLFWLWYVDNYHPRKLTAVIVFQTAVFLAFLLAHLAQRIVRRGQMQTETPGELNTAFDVIGNFEALWLVLVNPFVYFATAYHFLNPEHHNWMGAFAIVMAAIYAGAAKLMLGRRSATQTELLLMIGVALTFVTLAIPIQLKSNWITMAWAVEGLAILWGGVQIKSRRLRAIAHALFGLALLRLVFWDTPFDYRQPFTPILNKYFLSSLFVTACLFAGALTYQKLGKQKDAAARVFQLVLLMVGIIALWFLMTIETFTYFEVRAAMTAADYQHEKWLGQMTLSVLWSIYAALLAAIGFVRRAPAVRWAALSLFAITVIKVMMVDIAVLQQLYRITAFLVLGLLLLVVAWGYHKVFHSKEAST